MINMILNLLCCIQQVISDRLHDKHDVKFIVVRTGSDAEVKKNDSIAGGRGRSFSINSFLQKIKQKSFVKDIAGENCSEGLYFTPVFDTCQISTFSVGSVNFSS